MNKTSSKKSVFIVIPTYNEAENIESLIEELAKVSRQLKSWNVEILVVDDNSPDGTAKIVEKLQHKYAPPPLRAQRAITQTAGAATLSAQRAEIQNHPDATPSAQENQTQTTATTQQHPHANPNSFPTLHLLINQHKKGLGAAYTKAFTYILKNHNPDYIIQMDADFQHDPSDIPRFLAKTAQSPDSIPSQKTAPGSVPHAPSPSQDTAQSPDSAAKHHSSNPNSNTTPNPNQTYEFIIGSRYVAGGDYPNWSFKRKLYSWGANLIARFIAGIYNIDDCTSGFRCISAKFLRSLDLKTLKSDGYAFQMSLLHAASKKRIPIIQIPILFPNRRKGRSKLGHKDILEFFVNAFKLRFKRYHWR